ncbi:MAG: ATP-binding cassette domain-containing protein [Chitinivibrionales bacterium]|nr:ATP-binding cassette domain-containing protein [Chitinivibrionales bacterium]
MISLPVKLENLKKRFFTFRGPQEVLKGITLSIDAGELFVLLGPSGCGKSTLLNLIAGLEKPTEGTVTIGNMRVADPAAKLFREPFDRDVAMVFQSYALYPHMTVEQNIAFPLTNLGKKLSKSEIQQAVQKIAELLKIENLLDRKPKELSGGQRQRVAIGRAIVREPKVFLMDEPLSNLDAQLRMEMRAQLKALQRKLGITMIYVTHDQVEAMTLGDRIAVLHEGQVQQLGPPAGIYDNPETIFVAQFIGSPPMNIISGSLLRNEKAWRIENADFTFSLPPEAKGFLQQRGITNVKVGVRPEHVTPGNPGEGCMDVSVTVAENIGGEYLLYVLFDTTRLILRTPVKPANERTSLKVDPEKILFFDSNGKRIR